VAVTASGVSDVRVLLVDDTGTLASTIRPCLERAGCEVVVSDDVGPALALVDAFMPDAVLVKHHLPSGTAFDLLGSIRSDPRWAGTGVVLVAEDFHSAELLAALDLGADDFLCAPFKPVELVARLQAVLRRRVLVTPVRVAEARLAAAATASAGTASAGGAAAEGASEGGTPNGASMEGATSAGGGVEPPVGRDGAGDAIERGNGDSSASRSTVPHGAGGPLVSGTDADAAPPGDPSAAGERDAAERRPAGPGGLVGGAEAARGARTAAHSVCDGERAVQAPPAVD
jgi:CheY-like chemotaxis protein